MELFWLLIGLGGFFFLLFAGLALVMQASKRSIKMNGKNLSSAQLEQVLEHMKETT